MLDTIRLFRRPPRRPKNHEVYRVHEGGYTGKTWCARWLKRGHRDDPWMTEWDERITGHPDDCGQCRRAKAMNQPWCERKPPAGTRHEVRPTRPGHGRTLCGKPVTAGGSETPWKFRYGQSATEGDRDCIACQAAKAAERRRAARRVQSP